MASVMFPVGVCGYGSEGDYDKSVRDYYIGETCIASAKVMYFDDCPSTNPVGYLLGGQLYRGIDSLERRIGEIVIEELLKKWNE